MAADCLVTTTVAAARITAVITVAKREALCGVLLFCIDIQMNNIV